MFIGAELRASTFAESISASTGAGKQAGVATLTKTRNSDWSPLHWAAADGHIPLFESLLESGKHTASDTYTFYTGSRIIKENIRNDGINAASAAAQSGYTPLHWAAIRGNAEMADYLLAHGADPAIQDKHGNRAFTLADKKGFKSIAENIRSYEEAKAANKEAAAEKKLEQAAAEKEREKEKKKKSTSKEKSESKEEKPEKDEKEKEKEKGGEGKPGG